MIKISLEPTIYTDLLHQIYDGDPFGAPKGTFYILSRDTIPYVPRPTSFRIETNRIGENLKIYINRLNVPDNDNRMLDLLDEIDYTPQSSISTVSITLGSGLNIINIQTVSGSYEENIIKVETNNIVTFWQAFLQDYYTNVIKKIDNQKNSINSLYATRLVEPFLPIQDLLPETQSFKSITTRLAIVNFLHSAGTNEGTNDILKSLTLGTPIYKSMDKDTFDFDPDADPWTNLASQFYGTEAHAWIPNYGITKFICLIKYLSANPSNYQILEINEQQIRYMYQGLLRTHNFDLDRYGSDFLQSLTRSECFNNIRVSLTKSIIKTFRFKSASYTFDLVLNHPIGKARKSFDINVPLDQNLPFDSDSVDPFTDGWLGWSLSGRFGQYENQQFYLDSFVAHTPPHYGDPWAYDSNLVQCLFNMRSDIPLPINIVCRMGLIKI